jgi:hypothetical protein
MAEDATTRKKPADHLTELKDLVVGYAKQETLDPLVNLKQYLGWGIAGSMLVAIGCLFGLFALLRGLQAIDWFEHDSGVRSLIPYGATIVAAAVMVAMAGVKIKNDHQKDQRS